MNRTISRIARASVSALNLKRHAVVLPRPLTILLSRKHLPSLAALIVIGCGGTTPTGAGGSTGTSTTGNTTGTNTGNTTTGGDTGTASKVASIELIQTARPIVGDEFDVRIVPHAANGDVLPFTASDYQITFDSASASSVVKPNADGFHLRANASLVQVEHVTHKATGVSNGLSYTQYGVWTGTWKYGISQSVSRLSCVLKLTQVGDTLSGTIDTDDQPYGGSFVETTQASVSGSTCLVKGLAFTSATPDTCTIASSTGTHGPCAHTTANLTYVPSSKPTLTASLYQPPTLGFYSGASFVLQSR